MHVLHGERGWQPDERLWAARRELVHDERGAREHLWAARREVSTREKQPARSPTAVMRMAATHVAVRTVRRPKAAGAVASLSGLGRMDAHLRAHRTFVRPMNTHKPVRSPPMRIGDWYNPPQKLQP